MKKLIALLMALLMIASLAACGENSDDDKDEETTVAETTAAPEAPAAPAVEGYLMQGSSDPVAVEAPETALDPAEVYSKLTYTPEMFYGTYRITGGKEGQRNHMSTVPQFDYATDKAEKLSAIPTKLIAGPHNINHILSNDKDHDWLQAHFVTERNDAVSIYCAYTVEGNKLTLNLVDSFNFDASKNVVTYVLTDIFLEYEFAFSGTKLTLTYDETSVDLFAGLDASEDTVLLTIDGYLVPDTDAIDDKLNVISFYFNNSTKAEFLVADTEDNTITNASAVLNENGLFTMTIPWESGTKTYQFVYFYSYFDGITLTDGTNTYHYNYTYSDILRDELSAFLTDDTGLDKLTEEQLEMITEKKDSLLQDLVLEYELAGLSITINSETGEVAMDSAVLFDVDESVVSEEGKTFLSRFLDVYTSVVFSTEYEDFVSEIVVEGHTDTSGDYDMNKTLSQERADNVMAYCLSEDAGIDADYTASLKDIMRAEGFSYDYPVYDEDGNVDMDASRRVSFRFIIDLASAQ
ncbi:MAG: OmpA family protein [Ruminococcus sp.]|nr:OmpA family protein [Ruminococcus sp.]